jgi:hypothetical protein
MVRLVCGFCRLGIRGDLRPAQLDQASSDDIDERFLVLERESLDNF